jgi:PAS domain S-box-containing protein
MNNSELENRIKDLELELSNLKSDLTAERQTAQALKENNYKFLSLATIIGHIAYVNPTTLQYEYVNDAYEKSFGIPKEKIIGRYVSDIIGDTNYQFALKYILEAKSGKHANYENEFNTSSGKRWLQVHYSPVLNDCGIVVSIAVLVFDITKKKETEIALKESEEKYRFLSDNVSDGILLFEANNKLKYISDGCLKMCGYEPQDFDYLNFDDIFSFLHEDDVQQIKETFQSAHSKQIEKFQYNYRLKTKDGKYIWAEDKVKAEYDHAGNHVRSVHHTRNITERKQAEEAIKESEQRFSLFMDYLPALVFIKDIESRTIYANKAIDRSLGASKWLGLKVSEIFDCETTEKILADDNKTLQTGYQNIEESFTNLDGKIHHYETQKFIISSSGQKALLGGISIDITERKKAELIITKQNASLTKLNSDKDLFMSILAHDLKSPFNGLLGLSGILAENIREYDIDKIENLVNYINTSAKSTYNLLEDLLMWVKSQSGKMTYQPELLSFKDICKDFMEILEPIADEKDITIKCIASEKILVFADEEMLKTVIRNLVTNAIKFSFKGGTISISAEKNDENITVSVKDNGIGITPELITKLFDMSLMHSTTGTAGEKGTGLGLLLCKEFIERHGGRVWVESEVGKGSKFSFLFPHKADEINT